MPHQEAVLTSWREAGNRGIVSFATGTGKTLVALHAIREWTHSGKPALVLVPGRELHKQWAKELSYEIPEATPLLCGAGHGQGDWGDLLRDYSSPHPIGRAPRVILSTNATFASAAFHHRLSHGDHLLVVADEVHRVGAHQKLFAVQRTAAGATMGLSATYRRQFDEPGTEQLIAWFGPVLEPVIGIAEGILMGRLVPYDYRLHTLTLDEDELERYQLLTDRIRRAAAISEASQEGFDYVQLLLIERARILKQARGKAPAAIDILLHEYEEGARWLVYCDGLDQLNEVVRQGLGVHLPVMEYHSAMSGDREVVLQSFDRHGGVVVAIRCLDEGWTFRTVKTH